jgi:hypothetical protein
VNTSQYVDLLRAWIYPEVHGLNVTWVSTADNPNKGLVVIEIPKQDAAAGPFLITKTIEGSKTVETVFGYAARKGDRNPPLDVKELQRYLRSGLDYRTQIEKRFDALEAMIKVGTEGTKQETILKGKAEQIEQRIARAIEHSDLRSRRTLIISAQPMQSKELRTIFVNEEGSIKRHLERPPIIRQNGWTLETLEQAKILRGEMIRVTNGDRKIVDLYRDGTMVFAASADRDFLAWAAKNKPRINPLALVEVILSFVSLYALVVADFIAPPSQISFRIDLRNMHYDGVKSSLGPYSLQSMSWQYSRDDKEAPENDWSYAKVIDTMNLDVHVITYDLVKEVYLWFGFDEKCIPYSSLQGGVRKTDPDLMLKSGGH